MMYDKLCDCPECYRQPDNSLQDSLLKAEINLKNAQAVDILVNSISLLESMGLSKQSAAAKLALDKILPDPGKPNFQTPSSEAGVPPTDTASAEPAPGGEGSAAESEIEAVARMLAKVMGHPVEVFRFPK